MFVAYVSINTLTHKVKELEGEMLVAGSSSILNDSVDNEDAVIDQGCDEEDEDDETIEEQPDGWMVNMICSVRVKRPITQVLKMNPLKPKEKGSVLVNI